VAFRQKARHEALILRQSQELRIDAADRLFELREPTIQRLIGYCPGSILEGANDSPPEMETECGHGDKPDEEYDHKLGTADVC